MNVTGPNFNLNFLLALSMAYFSEKSDIQNYEENFQNIQNPKGRFEIINFKSNKIVVDYAHTPDAIKTTVDFVTQYFSSVIVVFGAGGDRDIEKRLLMGNATKNADQIIKHTFQKLIRSKSKCLRLNKNILNFGIVSGSGIIPL